MEVERRARENAPAPYRRRRPEDTLLYRTVQTHLRRRARAYGDQ